MNNPIFLDVAAYQRLATKFVSQSGGFAYLSQGTDGLTSSCRTAPCGPTCGVAQPRTYFGNGNSFWPDFPVPKSGRRLVARWREWPVSSQIRSYRKLSYSVSLTGKTTQYEIRPELAECPY
jgi:hypothetical protein